MRFWSALIALALALTAISCGASDSRTALLRLKAAPGDLYRLQYQTKTALHRSADEKAPASDEDSTLTLVRRYKCTASKEGKTTWEVSTEQAKGEGSGGLANQAQIAAQDELSRKPKSIERDERNVVMGEAKTSPIEFEFPIQEVQTGDSWRSEARLFGSKIDMIYTVEAFEKVDGKDAVRISGRVEEARGISLTKPLNAWYEIATGWPIKGDCELTMDEGSGTQLKVNLHMERK